MEENPTATPMQAWKQLKRQGYPGGVKLTTKDLRDHFATQVSAQVMDPNTVKNLMRHTSLTTTSRYVRAIPDRMKAAVKNLGRPLVASVGGNSSTRPQHKNTQTNMLREFLVRLVNERNDGELDGGRSRSRTYDLAHVRRAL
jgi:hypothetical protein